MTRPPVDLRSDTLTRPTADMRRAMAEAEVGDDVYGEDPTVNRLQERVAELLGKEAALFVPSGTMANQIALHILTRPGDEVICEETAHIHLWEAGAPALLSGLTLQLVPGRRGVFDVADLEGRIQPDNMHHPRSRVLALENTHNRGGGTIFPLATVQAVEQWGRGNGLAMHLDGARLMNAVVATGIDAATWAASFDTVCICFSKGLGAPVGSALASTRANIAVAVRFRKILGGAMRQAGVLAAAALHALDHHVDRLADDHANARRVAERVAELPGLAVDPSMVETNLVWIGVDRHLGPAAPFVAALRDRGVLVSALGPQLLRACTHLDVDGEGVDHACRAFAEVFQS